MKKKVIATLLASAMTATLLAGCGTTVETTGSGQSSTSTQTEESAAPAETESVAAETEVASAETNTDLAANITLWTYPIGKWGDSATVDSLISSFNKVYPNINVAVEYLDYTNGDDQVNTAIEGGQAPDLVMEGPERLVLKD